MRAVVAMDSFKGSLTSLEAGNAVKRGILKACPDAQVDVLPLADGGEGTLDCIAPFTGGDEIALTVTGPLGSPVDTSYIYDPKTSTAYIEMARASGLTLISPEERDPFLTTSYGTGELMKDALSRGAERLVVFVGGSATNDGGAGMLQALGARFTDDNAKEIRRGAIGLKDLANADFTELAGRGVKITVASDVTNPLCGPDGASFVYGPQKGASQEACARMDEWLGVFARKCGFDPFEKGTGAAGGMSFALKNVLGADIRSGAQIVAEVTGIAPKIKLCNIVITGEGRMDGQTVRGKAPHKILEIGLKYNKPVMGITGMTGEGVEACLAAGFSRIVPLIRPTMVREEAVLSVEETAEALFRGLSDMI